MKLEIKHLKNYFGTGLKVTFKCDEYIHDLAGLNIYDHGVLVTSPFNDCGDAKIEDVIPLLLPLSALTEQLPDGSMPIVELAKIAWNKDYLPDNFLCQSLKENTVFIAFSDKKNVLGYDSNTNSFFGGLNGVSVSVVRQLQLFEYLFANHFDVYGLIDVGLAIDKRSCQSTSN